MTHIFTHVQNHIGGAFRPRLIPTGNVSVTVYPMTWADTTGITWGDGTILSWAT
jgi:hypothetical protein